MRVTGGTAGGHTLATPKAGNRIRPTSDRTREALFNILGPKLSGSRVLDLYAGTGSLGIEALSRGADSAVFVDSSKASLELIHKNLTHCFSSPRAILIQLNLSRTDTASRLLKKLPQKMVFNLVFLDPPYEKNLAQPTLQMVEKAGILASRGTVIIEERKNEQLPQHCGRLQLSDQRRYGETGLWFYTLS